MNNTEQKKAAREHAASMLREYFGLMQCAPQTCPSLYGNVARVDNKGTGITRAYFVFVIVDGRPIDVCLYVANLCGYRRDKIGMILPGQHATMQDIATAVGQKLGMRIKDNRP